MKVLYNSDIFDIQTHGGISRSVVELVKHFPSDVQAVFGVKETDNVHLAELLGLPPHGEALKNFMNGRNIPCKKFFFKLYENLGHGHLKNWDKYPPINKDFTIELMQKGDYDVYHPTFYYDDFTRYNGDKPIVMTIHDLIADVFAEYGRTREVAGRKNMIPHVSHFVAVSNYTKENAIKFYNIPEDKITVIYHGQDESLYVPGNNRLPYDYILYTGTRVLYKNFMPFATQCLPILKRHKELKIVCTSVNFSEAEKQFFKENGVEDRFIHIFTRTDQELMDLYHYAVAFVFPSLYEGFGIPILEAYKADCPVMLVPYSCFPEIARDAAVYFELKDGKSDFEDKFETLYHLSSDERNSLLEKQRQRMKQFSWTKASRELASVYRGII